MSFSTQILKFGDNASKRVQQLRRGTTIKLLSSVIRDSPVLTGRFRANWQLTTGEPATGTLDVKAPNKGGLDAAEIKQIQETDGDTPVFLTNNLPYGPKLEFDGHSDQAPEGMVRRNVARFGRLIKVEVQNKQP